MQAGISGSIVDRMRWLQARTRVLSENVANADTPRFVPRDLVQAGGGGSLAPLVTDARHLGGNAVAAMRGTTGQKIDTRPSGNAVTLEDEMLKLSDTQLEYQMLTTLYQRGLGTLKTALGRRA